MMPRYPECGHRLSVRGMFGHDLRQVPCARCPAIYAVQTRAALLPAILLILLGPPVAKAVQEGWFSIGPAIAGGALVLLATGWIGYASSSTSLVRRRHEPA